LAAQRLIDQSFVDKRSWIKKAILTTARMGKFSSDRAVMQYAEEVSSGDFYAFPR
jgi:starch phosphorylase